MISKLEDILELQITGEWGTECKDDFGVSILRTTNFTNIGEINYINVIKRKIEDKKIETKRLVEGDIILEKSGGSDNIPVGRVVFCDSKINENIYLCNNFTQALRVNENKALSKYIFYFLHYQHKRGFTELLQNKTTGIRNLQLKEYMKMKIPIPLIEQQEKIVNLIDKVYLLIKLRNEQIKQLDLLIKSRFVEMFGDPITNSMNLQKGKIRDVVVEVKYGTSRPSVDDGKYKYIRMNNITYNGELDLSELKYIDIPEKEVEKCIVQKGDLLFNRTNSKELVGKTCVFNQDESMIVAGYIIRVRMNDKALPEYLCAVLNSRYGKETLLRMCKAIVGQANINAQELQDIQILIPPIELQYEFVKFREQVDKLKFELQNNLKELNTLYNALMQKCFG